MVEADQVRQGVPEHDVEENAGDPSPVRADAGDTTEGGPEGATGGQGDHDSLQEQVLEALRNVHDPELGINIVDLGLVYGVEIERDTVHITYTLTTMGCPIGPLIEAEIQQFLSGVEGIHEIEAEMVLRPAWTPEMMSEEAKAALGFF